MNIMKRIPGRRNVVLYWINNNTFETIAVLEETNTVRKVFDENHPLIQSLK